MPSWIEVGLAVGPLPRSTSFPLRMFFCFFLSVPGYHDYQLSLSE